MALSPCGLASSMPEQATGNGKSYEYIILDDVLPGKGEFSRGLRILTEKLQDGTFVAVPPRPLEDIIKVHVWSGSSDFMDDALDSSRFFFCDLGGVRRRWNVRDFWAGGTGYEKPGEPPKFHRPKEKPTKDAGHGTHKQKQKNRAARKAAEKAKKRRNR